MQRDLSQSEAAERLGKSVETLRRWRRAGGHGPSFRVIGASVRYPESSIADYLRAQTRVPCSGGSRPLTLLEAAA